MIITIELLVNDKLGNFLELKNDTLYVNPFDIGNMDKVRLLVINHLGKNYKNSKYDLKIIASEKNLSIKVLFEYDKSLLREFKFKKLLNN